MRQYTIDEDSAGIIARTRCFALDLDGTVYLEGRWIDGAPAFLQRIAQSGRQFIFMTNNSSRSRSDYVEKLHRMGLAVKPAHIITSGNATIGYLQRHHAGKRVYLLGNRSLCREFEEAGIPLDDAAPQVVVTAYDTELDYSKLCRVCALVRAGLPYIATHPDINCPTREGFVPDIGAIHAFIEASAGRWPDVVVGKPGHEMVSRMLAQAGAEASTTTVVGDRLYTDIAAGKNNGLASVLVLSGESRLEDLATAKAAPDLVFSSVRAMIPLLG